MRQKKDLKKAMDLCGFALELIGVQFKHFTSCLGDAEFNSFLESFATYHHVFIEVSALVGKFQPYYHIWVDRNRKMQYIYTTSDAEVLNIMFEELDSVFSGVFDALIELMKTFDQAALLLGTQICHLLAMNDTNTLTKLRSVYTSHAQQFIARAVQCSKNGGYLHVIGTTFNYSYSPQVCPFEVNVGDDVIFIIDPIDNTTVMSMFMFKTRKDRRMEDDAERKSLDRRSWPVTNYGGRKHRSRSPPRDSTVIVRMNNNSAGKIVGRDGSNIQRLRRKFACGITVHNTECHDVRICRITGWRSDLRDCEKYIHELISNT